MKISTGQNVPPGKGSRTADSLAFGVQARGTRGEILSVAPEEEEAIADMISEGSPVVEASAAGKKARATPKRKTR